MKNEFNMKKILLSVLFLSFIGVFTSCDDWTNPESMSIETPDIQAGNNASYQLYLENLRNYKKSYHKTDILSSVVNIYLPSDALWFT